MTRVVEIWRHPIKAHGREALEHVSFAQGKTMPWDRTWAVAHEASKADETSWAACANFSRGAKAPGLMGIWAKLDEATETLTLRHKDLGELTFSPNDAPEALIAWARPLIPVERAQSARIVRVKDRGMTDTNFPSISIGNLASHRAVEAQLGQSISNLRWRTNIWLDGATAWDEFEWIGKTIRIGTAEFAIREPVGRCLATTANPETGKRDIDTLGALKAGWDHQNFCVYGEVVKAGDVATGDTAEVL